MKVTKALRDLLKRDKVLVTLGAHDALSAKIIEKAGIQAIITAGFGISASHLGKPDAELYTMTENLAVVRNMAVSVGIPIIADLDTLPLRLHAARVARPGSGGARDALTT